ncbi:hypothetical protein [Vulcaniibacterium tengchongense]|uniref:Uncharacterized protein n=1 Tax=Vulcaniibacterium tengchongense TaxID=1273429 RepID=A0A3N4UXC2_9GAMM|nr:hypothetical protein [Vulcaniibacterium tengchongense]RPE74653.1 hypothetical protein EDC50_3182 [Vulcaniibacterium tengchongense]
MLELALLSIAPAVGGALLYRLWSTRPRRATHAGLAVGQIPVALRRRRMAVRREVTHG